jgi:hypothetical protein
VIRLVGLAAATVFGFTIMTIDAAPMWKLVALACLAIGALAMVVWRTPGHQIRQDTITGQYVCQDCGPNRLCSEVR